MSLLPSFLTRPPSYWVESARGTIGGVTWGPSVKLAKWAVDSLFRNIEVGTLVLVDEAEGTSQVYGETGSKKTMDNNHTPKHRLVNGDGASSHAPPRVELVVKKSAFWMRLVLFADMGFAEAFMLGEVECDDLTAFFKVRRKTCICAAVK